MTEHTPETPSQGKNVAQAGTRPATSSAKLPIALVAVALLGAIVWFMGFHRNTHMITTPEGEFAIEFRKGFGPLARVVHVKTYSTGVDVDAIMNSAQAVQQKLGGLAGALHAAAQQTFNAASDASKALFDGIRDKKERMQRDEEAWRRGDSVEP